MDNHYTSYFSNLRNILSNTRLFRKRESERNTTIDSIRLIAAFLIVFIHCGAFSEWAPSLGKTGAILQAVARLAVPFFFLASGYFLYTRNQSIQSKRIILSFEKIFKIFLLGTLLFAAVYIIDHRSIAGLFDSVTPASILGIFLYSTPVIGGIMWYLLALMGAYLILWVNATYIKKDTAILILGAVLYIMGMLIAGNYSTIFDSVMHGSGIYRSFWGFGLLFVTLGFLVHKYQDKIMTISRSALVLYTVIFSTLYLAEYYSFYQVNSAPDDTFIVMPFISALLFVWCLKLPRLFSTTPLPTIGSRYSLYIYIVHPIVLEVLLRGIILEPLLRLLIAFFGSLLLGIIYYHVKEYLKSTLQKRGKVLK